MTLLLASAEMFWIAKSIDLTIFSFREKKWRRIYAAKSSSLGNNNPA